MKSRGDRAVAMTALRAAIPYLRLFQGKTFVIKAGGEVFASPVRSRGLLEQVGVFHQLGIRVVLVHGGGAQATDLANKLGVESRFVEGRRVTDAPMRDVTTMTLNGSVNTGIVADCRSLGIPGVGLSGIDGGMIRARRRPPRAGAGDGGAPLDYGYVGDVVSVDASVVEGLLEKRFLPIISPLCSDSEGEILNVNADVVAATLAREMKAEKFIVVTGAPGILADASDPSSLVSYTDVKGLNDLHESGSLKDGMLPKVTAIKDALYGGVSRVHVISHSVTDSLLLEVFTNEGSGTLVVLDTQELMPEEAAAGRVMDLLDAGEEQQA